MKKIKNLILSINFPPITQSIKSFSSSKKSRIVSSSTQTSNNLKKFNFIPLTERNITSTSSNITLKNFLNQKMNNNGTFYQTEIKPLKKKLFVRKNFFDEENTQKFAKLNKIFGFKEVKKKRKINLFPENNIGEREDYKLKILRDAILSFQQCKASVFAHKLTVDYLISDITKSRYLFDTKHNKLVSKAKKYSEYLNTYRNECVDKYTDKYIESLDISKRVKKLFMQDYETDYLSDENFSILKKYENRVNFEYDCYHVPIFKNKFLKYNKIIDSEISFINELDCPNFIDLKVWKHLNMFKIKIQKFKDMNIHNINLIKNLYFDVYVEKKEKKKKNDEAEDIFLDSEILLEKKEGKNEKKYDLEDYFIYKKSIQNNVKIANDRLKNFVFTKFKNIH